MKTNSLKPSLSSMFNVRCARFTLAPATPPAAPRSPLAFRLSVFCFLLFVGYASAATRYVWQDSPSPWPPYDTWANAAHDIQTAVDAADPSDEIVVTNGVYATGGRAVGTNVLVNRVAVDKPLTLRSVNGPEFTIIRGYQVPSTTNGDGAIRCVYLSNGASLSGFTLTNGATRTTHVNPTYPDERSAGGVWCESTNAAVYNCVLSGNSAHSGGGAFGGTLYNCVLTANSALYGGGAYGGTLNNCTLTGNSAAYYGGGARSATLINCTLTDNSAHCGGGAGGGTLYNCTLTRNSAGSGGGAWCGTLNNCTLSGNSAEYGGGTCGGTLNNCVVYFNTAPNGVNHSGGTLNYCCTTPRPTEGAGNTTDDPQLASASHLSLGSPCRGAGSAAYASGTDIDGEPWLTPPSIGCDEYHAGAVTGPLSVSIAAAYTNVAAACEVSFIALIEGLTAASEWDFGDGSAATNQPYTAHAWAALGDYAVVLRAYNESHPSGVSATVMVHVVETPVHYVALDNANPLPPYTSWATAATNIQDAVDATLVPGSLVLVSNGVYATGERGWTRVAVDKPVHVRSVNGAEVTVIEGSRGKEGSGIGCVRLANSASLSGFTLTNGRGGVRCESLTAVVSNCVLSGNSVSDYGGGAYGGTLYNCVLAHNTSQVVGYEGMGFGGGAYGCTLYNCMLISNSVGGSYLSRDAGGGACDCTLYKCTLIGNSGHYGGGAYDSTLNNCTLTGNSATGYYGNGGGADNSTLNNCTLTSNWADYAGGADASTLNNCIVYFNTAPYGANYCGGTLNYCCTTPMPSDGIGNITDDPQLASATYLSASSPCRGAGSAAYASGTDIDGEVWANPPSIGCDEYHPGELTGPLTVSWSADRRAVTPGYTVSLTAFIQGRASASVWDFGDGVVVSNQPYAGHAWTASGDYAVVLRAYNESHPEGVGATGMIHVAVHSVLYVAVDSAHPSAPYSSWATAARTIQDAVDVAGPGTTLVVSNGWYGTGGRDGNRVVADRALSLQSVNGPEWTVIDGGRTVRGVHLGGGANLSGFTVTNGTASFGGGVYCESGTAVVTNSVLTSSSAYGGGGAFGGTLNNCMLSGNSAESSGGGACGSTLNNCTLSGNSAYQLGGGASYDLWNDLPCTLNNCTLTGNSAVYNGGGAYQSTLNNCIVYFNTAPNGTDHSGGTLNYCCTTPMPTGGIGNITNAPLFVDYAGGDFRLRPDSPCIDAGTNLTGLMATDLLGLPRPMDGNGDGLARFDIGAHEFNPYRFEPTLHLSGDGFWFTVRGEPGRSVRIERSPDLVHWEYAGEVPIPACGQTLIDPAATTEPHLFYRAMRVP